MSTHVWQRGGIALALSSAFLSACDDCERSSEPRVVPIVDTGGEEALPSAAREGCERSGALAAIEHDMSCIVPSVREDVMLRSIRSLSLRLTADPDEVFTSGASLLELSIQNVSNAEVRVVFEAYERPPGARTDWSRVAGIPAPHAAANAEGPRLFFPLTTTDKRDRDVDEVPILSGSTPVPSPPTLLLVWLRPGARLVHKVSWWALRIPAPLPIVKDDAGHKFIPKTTAIPLYSGEYAITMEVPLFGLRREERVAKTRVKVKRAPLLDGGVRATY